MFGAAAFGRILYSGAPVEHVERSATVQFSCSSLIIIALIGLASVSAIHVSASALSVSAIQGIAFVELSALSPPVTLAANAYASFEHISETRASYSTICVSSLSLMLDVSVVSSATLASTALEIKANSKSNLTLQSVAQVELLIPSISASVSTSAYSQFALSASAKAVNSSTASSSFKISAYAASTRASTRFIFEAVSSPTLITQAVATFSLEPTVLGLGELAQAYANFLVSVEAKPSVIVQGQVSLSCTAESRLNQTCKAKSDLGWQIEAALKERLYGFAESKAHIDSVVKSTIAAPAVLSLSVTAYGSSRVATTLTCQFGLRSSAYAIARVIAAGEAVLSFLASTKAREARTAVSEIRIDGVASVLVSLIASAEGRFASQALYRVSESGCAGLKIDGTAQTSFGLKATVTLAFRSFATPLISAEAFVSISLISRRLAIHERAVSLLTISSSARHSKLKTSFAFTAQAKPSYPRRALARLAFYAQGTYPGLVIPTYEIKLSVGGVDLSNRVRSWSMRFNFDAGAWTLDLELINHEQLVAERKGLAPWDPISDFNKNGPLLGQYNPVKFYVREEPSQEWFLLFDGFVGPTTVDADEVWGEADTVRVTCVGPSQPLKDWMIEERLALRYTDAPLAKVSFPHDLLNQIVRDQGFNVVVYYKDEPSFYVREYIVSNVSLWEALINALAPTGFRLIEHLDLVNGGLRLMVVDPLRFNAQVDRVLTRFRARRISGSEADVRTWVGVVYRDRFDFQEKLVWAEASSEIVALYGIPDGKGGKKHRKMVYRTSDRSLVDTESEARELAAMILWDLETPSPSLEVEIPWIDLRFWPFQLILVRGRYMDTLMGVQEIEWSWSWERPCGETRLRGAAGRVVGAKNLWFARDAKRGMNREILEIEELIESARSVRPNQPTVVGSWFQHQDGSPKPVIDVLLAEPPSWAKGVFLKIYRLAPQDTGLVASMVGREIQLAGKNYPAGRFASACGDYLLVQAGPYANRMWLIRSVSGDRVFLAEDPGVVLSQHTNVIIARVRRIETRGLPLTRFVRIEDVREGEIIGVCYAWTT